MINRNIHEWIACYLNIMVYALNEKLDAEIEL